jgi:hypothetical protein
MPERMRQGSSMPERMKQQKEETNSMTVCMRGIKVVAHTSIEVEVKRKKPMTQLFQETKKKKA